MKTTVIVDDNVFNETKKVLNELGLTFSDAVNLFTQMIAKYKVLPFEQEFKKEILKRIEEVEDNQNIEEFCLKDLEDEIKKA